MGKRITIYDLSKELGLSTATINRALNGKPYVGSATKELVLKTAQAMGFKPNRAARSLARKPIKIAVIATNNCYEYFCNEIIQGAKYACSELADYNVTADYFMIMEKPGDQKAWDELYSIPYENYDGVVMSTRSDKRRLTDWAAWLTAKNVYYASVISEIVGSSAVFSIQNNGIVAGQMAAQLLSWLVSGNKVAVMTGSKDDLKIHVDTINGFIQQAGKLSLEVINIYESMDDPDIAYVMAEKLIRDYPNIDGIYINSANSITICNKIIEKGLKGKVKVIASDIFPELADMIRRDVVQASIFQDPFAQGKIAFEKLYQYITEGKVSEKSMLINPSAIFRSNLELFE